MGAEDAAESAIRRRSAIQRLAAAGAITWAAPVVLSSRASAQDSACTPKCTPVSGDATVPDLTRLCSFTPDTPRTVRISLVGALDVPAVCPCGGASPTSRNRTVTSSNGTVSRASSTAILVTLAEPVPSQVTITVTVTAQCIDRDGSQCTTTCATDYLVNVNLANDVNCSPSPELSATYESTSVTCG